MTDAKKDAAEEDEEETFSRTDYPGKVSMKDFALLRVLGKGAYGKVFLVRKVGGPDNGAYYAMKVLKKERLIGRAKSLEHVLMERTVLERLCSGACPFLVNLVYAFQSEAKLHIVMEYVGGGELFTHLCKRKSFPVAEARVLIGELALALNYIHEHGVIYRDLKLENILIDQSGHIKLTDFGLSKAYKEIEPTFSYCGTVEYMAPEVVKRTPKGYTKIVDYWSLGVISFELLTGCSPFTVDGDHNSAQEVAKRVLNKPVPFPKSMDPVSRSFISALLDRNPDTRLGNRGFGELKSHPFFDGLDWELLEKRQIDPPIKPVIHSKTDVHNFDLTFTSQKPVFTPAECPSGFQHLFRGYSFIPPSLLFNKNNAIGEEAISESMDELVKSSPFFSKYELLIDDSGYLGRGTFSVVRKCRRLEDGKFFAVKIVSQKFGHYAMREVRILELVNPHKNIVQLVECLSDPLHFYLVMELLEGGELLQRLRQMKTFTEACASRLMGQLVSAVSHIHRKSAVHRDLKPENIIFANDSDDAELKLVDFGFARLLPNNSLELSTPCFTLEYAAPEVLEIEDELPQYNQQCDLWSLGVILFTMLSGKVPFNARSTSQSANEIISKIKTAEFAFDDPTWENVSDMAKDLITGLLTVDPKKRLKIGQVMKHPWLKNTSDAQCRELQTPTCLYPETGDKFNATMEAFFDCVNRNELFHLLDVETAPLLVKRRGLKRRSSGSQRKKSMSGGSSGGGGGHTSNGSSSSSKVPAKLMAVPEGNEMSISRRPTTLNIEMDEDSNEDLSKSPAFTQIRDTRPPDLKYSQDCHNSSGQLK